MYIDFSSSRHLSRLFRQDSDDTRSHQNWLARLAFCHRNGWIKVDSSEPDDWFDPNNFDLIKISSKGPYSQFRHCFPPNEGHQHRMAKIRAILWCKDHFDGRPVFEYIWLDWKIDIANVKNGVWIECGDTEVTKVFGSFREFPNTYGLKMLEPKKPDLWTKFVIVPKSHLRKIIVLELTSDGRDVMRRFFIWQKQWWQWQADRCRTCETIPCPPDPGSPANLGTPLPPIPSKLWPI
jgi:hypothetical protein